MTLKKITLSMSLFALLLSVESQASGCLESYHHWRNSSAWKVGLAPVLGAATLAGSGMLAIGWEYGGWTAFKSAIGPELTALAGGAINFAIPTGLAVGTLTAEGIQIARLLQAERAYLLVRDLHQETPKSHLLEVLVKRIQKKNPELSRNQIILDLRHADEDRELCDGSWSKRHPANLKEIERAILKLHASKV